MRQRSLHRAADSTLAGDVTLFLAVPARQYVKTMATGSNAHLRNGGIGASRDMLAVSASCVFLNGFY